MAGELQDLTLIVSLQGAVKIDHQCDKVWVNMERLRPYDLQCKTILPIIPQVEGGLSQQNPFRLLRSVRLPREEHEMPSIVPVTNNNCFVKIARNR